MALQYMSLLYLLASIRNKFETKHIIEEASKLMGKINIIKENLLSLPLNLNQAYFYELKCGFQEDD